MLFRLIFIAFFLSQVNLTAQSDSLLSSFAFEMDFRFRAEQDWDSQRSDGSFRNDRSRLRYRFRVGTTYQQGIHTMGFRLRTGDLRKQQDPQLTLGKAFKEFGTLPIGFEKLFYQGDWKDFKFWLGKNTYPFQKNNELFWSDNVFPEGVSIVKSISIDSSIINRIRFSGGHFILGSNNNSFLDDAFLIAIQSALSLANKRVDIFSTLNLFRNIPNIPDGNHSYLLDYTIFHLGSKIKLLDKKPMFFEFDFYHNLENYNQNTDILPELNNQKSGYVAAFQYGQLREKDDWMFKLTYANLHRYAIVDFMAQNDWARWDYSDFDSPDGRLSNFHGIEFVTAYSLSKKINLVVKYYNVHQLIPYGIEKESGQRVRLDFNMKI